MSLVLENSSDLIDLGDAIRSKTGGSSNLTIAQMATAVEGLTIDDGSDNRTWHSWANITPTITNNQNVTYDLSSKLTSNDIDWFFICKIHTSVNSNAGTENIIISPLFQFIYNNSHDPTTISSQYFGLDKNCMTNTSSTQISVTKFLYWVNYSYNFTTRQLNLTTTQSSAYHGIVPSTGNYGKLIYATRS